MNLDDLTDGLVELMCKTIKPKLFAEPDWVGGEVPDYSKREKWRNKMRQALCALEDDGWRVVPPSNKNQLKKQFS